MEKATIIDTKAAEDARIYIVRVPVDNPITERVDFFDFLVEVVDVCPGDVECVAVGSRCLRRATGMAAPAKARRKARDLARKAFRAAEYA